MVCSMYMNGIGQQFTTWVTYSGTKCLLGVYMINRIHIINVHHVYQQFGYMMCY